MLSSQRSIPTLSCCSALTFTPVWNTYLTPHYMYVSKYTAPSALHLALYSKVRTGSRTTTWSRKDLKSQCYLTMFLVCSFRLPICDVFLIYRLRSWCGFFEISGGSDHCSLYIGFDVIDSALAIALRAPFQGRIRFRKYCDCGTSRDGKYSYRIGSLN